VLAKTARLTESGDFARATKSGLRYTTANFVGYLYLTGLSQPARAGLIISKNTGGSVARHRVARQIRHALQEVYSQLPEGSLFVIRALKNPQKSKSESISSSNGQKTQPIDVADEVKNIVAQTVKKTVQKAPQK
jgi:ribonuclease P protein component